MFDFFVEKSANEAGAHVVHMDCCSAKPAKDQLYHIGVRSNYSTPVQEAEDMYSSAVPCPECMAV
jgi:hypothetical protein